MPTLGASYGSLGSGYTAYKNTSDPLVLRKNLIQVQNGDCTLWGDNLKDKASVEMNYTQELLKCNEIYLSCTQRYYKVTDRQLLSGKRLRLMCEVDLKTTALNELLGCTATFTRCEVENKDIVDNLVLKTDKTKISRLKIGTVPVDTTANAESQQGTFVTTVNII